MGPPGNRGSWGPCVLAQTQKTYEKGTRGISWGPLLTPGPRAVPEFPNGQSAPVYAPALVRTVLCCHSQFSLGLKLYLHDQH
ncbi:unnamed protein product [Staurois parvus]|uniref:Uncharacterized protein n=1 Tax=Staurois parvus TaxID=386267 RepID=A0ABN9EQG4_9NEOB|nr:unnamed protein product [Staurois parvus]